MLVFAMVFGMISIPQVNALAADTTSKLLDVSTLAAETITSSKTFGDFTVLATSDASVVIDANAKAIDGESFTQRLKLGGTGDAAKRCIQFKTEGNATVTIYAMSSSGSEDRTLELYKADGTAIGSVPALGASLTKSTLTIDTAGIYYLASPNKGVNVYKLALEAVGAAKEEKKVAEPTKAAEATKVVEPIKVTEPTKAVEATKQDTKAADKASEDALKVKELDKAKELAEKLSKAKQVAASKPAIGKKVDVAWTQSIFGESIDTQSNSIKVDGNKVTLESKDGKGKISSDKDGIAYYYTKLDANTDFTVSTKATLASIAANNQASFGIMLRSEVGANGDKDTAAKSSKMLLVGALNQKLQVASRAEAAGKYIQDNTFGGVPKAGTYDLVIKKTGDTYDITCNGESVTKQYPGLFTKDVYVGIYTSREAKVVFEGTQVSAAGVDSATLPKTTAVTGFSPVIFGESIDLENNTIAVERDKVTMTSGENKGKISTTKDGLAFYYSELDGKSNFELNAKATVESFDKNSQVSFGLMLRDTIGENGDKGTDEIKGAKMVAVGALEQKLMAFARTQEKGSYKDNITPDKILDSTIPVAKATYDLTIKKSGDLYSFSCNGVTTVTQYDGLFTDSLFAGLYTSRNTKVVFSDINLKVNKDMLVLELSEAPAKTSYITGQKLDLKGLKVTGLYEDGTIAVLGGKDVIVAGFDNTKAADQELTIGYAGQTVKVSIKVLPLVCEKVELISKPGKTTYYIGDSFDELGMAVAAHFNSGETKRLEASEYMISAPDLTTAGVKKVYINYSKDRKPDSFAELDVNVLADELKGLEVSKAPTKIVYYLGDTFDAKGMIIKAIYNEKVLLANTEYSISTLDSTSAGDKVVRVSYKGKTVEVPVTVKEKNVIGIKVTTLPKTTYVVGEKFDPQGCVVSTVFDNGTQQALEAYSIDSTQININQAGIYTVNVSSKDGDTSFNVAVREPKTYEWKSIEFGQSSSKEKNFVEAQNPGTVEGTIKVTALDGGGKFTKSQDGIAFYYTEVDSKDDNFELSADIKVLEFAKASPDAQEGFGIMARDAINTDGNSTVFYSNVAAVGGASEGTNKKTANTLMVMRYGINSQTDTLGATQEHIVIDEARPATANTYPAKEYRLTLRKTNTGYTGQLNNGKEVITYQPDALGIQDGKVYVGFYAARLATIEVSNVKFNVTAAVADAQRVVPKAAAVTPILTLAGLNATAATDYSLTVTSNVNGTITIKQGEKVIAQDKEVQANVAFVQKATLTAKATTPLYVTLTPSTDQSLTSYDRIVGTQTVTVKTYGTEKEAIFVSPTGKATAAGTQKDPLDLLSAIAYVQQGQTIYMLAGTYIPDTQVIVQRGNDGTASKLKTLSAYNNEKVVIDSKQKQTGFELAGNYWHIYGIDFTNSADNKKGFNVSGSHNIVELCSAYNNGDTGIQISRYGNVGKELWPAYNTILNCTSYDNMDSAANNADGFAAKLTVGEGNVFKGCIAYNNIDDGWDLYTKGESGPIGIVTIDGCITYNNGKNSKGTVIGDGNGFKLGGEGVAVAHIIKNSIAFNNLTNGFTSNSNPAVVSQNCVAFGNASANFDWRNYDNATPQFKATGNLSYKGGSKDMYPAALVNDSNFYFDGSQAINAAKKVLTEANFKSLEVPKSFKRDAVGNIIFGDFLSYIAK
jgi:hypothetical protein